MIAKINIGGVWVSFGYPQAPLKPEPFYPYLLQLPPIQEANGQETGSASFELTLQAKDLLSVHMRRPVEIYDSALELQFKGLLAELRYGATINAKVES